MNEIDAITTARTALRAQIIDLQSKLSKCRAVLAAIESARTRRYLAEKAPPGTLQDELLAVLRAAKGPMSNGQLRAALEAKDYAYSLTPLHVTKNLIVLHAARKIVRVGKGNRVKYVVAKRG